jgi:hypothetical protein
MKYILGAAVLAVLLVTGFTPPSIAWLAGATAQADDLPNKPAEPIINFDPKADWPK